MQLLQHCWVERENALVDRYDIGLCALDHEAIDSKITIYLP